MVGSAPLGLVPPASSLPALRHQRDLEQSNSWEVCCWDLQGLAASGGAPHQQAAQSRVYSSALQTFVAVFFFFFFMSWKKGGRVLIPGNDFLTRPPGFYWETPGGHTSSLQFARGQVPDASEKQLCQVFRENGLC